MRRRSECRSHVASLATSISHAISPPSRHEQGETLHELGLAWRLLPSSGGVLIGDDWGWPGVHADLLSFAACLGSAGPQALSASSAPSAPPVSSAPSAPSAPSTLTAPSTCPAPRHLGTSAPRHLGTSAPRHLGRRLRMPRRSAGCSGRRGCSRSAASSRRPPRSCATSSSTGSARTSILAASACAAHTRSSCSAWASGC